VQRADSGAPRLPAFLQHWLARRIAREEPQSAEGVSEVDFADRGASATALIEALRDDRLPEEAPPADTTCWSAWAVVTLVTVAMAVIGAQSLHATNPVLWVVALLALAAVMVAGLVLTLRDVLPARNLVRST
jgi:hypothetical protein